MAEYVLLFLILVQLLLLGTKRESFSEKLFLPLTYFGYLMALLFSLLFSPHGSGVELFYGALRSDELFQLPRVLVIAAGIFLLRMVRSSSQIATTRKPEVIFLMTVNMLLACILLLSNNFLMSYLSAVGMSLGSTILVCISHRDRKEVEGSHKYFLFCLIAILLSAAAAFVAVLAAGEPNPAKLGIAFAAWQHWSPWIGSAIVLAPLAILAGGFPFHFVTIDRDHAAPWPIQAHMTIHIGGVMGLSFLRLAVLVLEPHTRSGAAPTLLMCIGFLGLLGAMVSIPPAFTQDNLKRSLAYLSAGVWSLMAVTATLPTAVSLAVAVYWFLCASAGLLLVSWGLQSVFETTGQESFTAMSRPEVPRWGLLCVLIGILFLLPLPPSPGFGAYLLQVGAILERHSLGQFAWVVLIIMLLSITLGRFLVLLLKRLMQSDEQNTSSAVVIPYTDWGIWGLCTLLGVGIGCRWELLFSLLLRQAKSFIIL